MDFATRFGWVFALVIVLGCGGDDGPDPDDAGPDEDGRVLCSSDALCDDGLFCNGAETCAPSDPLADARGCRIATAPCGATETCDEAADRCDACRTDADGDGAIAPECGGDDCDDSDPDRFPGNAEVCDLEGLDEDCDPTTIGDTDADDDGAISSACCNGATCGNDCDDARPNVNASATEACDGFDNDCDGSVDEGVLRTFHPDGDGDGFGDPDGETRMSCSPPDGFVEDATDCDDGTRTVNPVAAERCANDIDDDCDGDTDESGVVRYYRDADGDTFGALGEFMDSASCDAPAGYVAIAGDCNDASAAYYPSAPDPCDGRDTSCNLPATPGAADPTEDADGDRHTAIDASCTVGDVGFGSYPKDDCDDSAASVHPGAPELCNRRDDVCATGGGVRTSEDVDGDGHAAPTASCTGGFPKDDCVDTDATIYPGAPERCDRLDNVCASGGGVRTSEDVDDDGHAAPAASCTGGFPKDDCVDTNASIHPGAPELCDRLDNVCASGGGARASEDADEDGFAAIAASCTGGPLPNTDCDDTRASVFPGARETCGGGDEDCDTVLDATDPDAARWCGPHASCDGTTCALDATLAAGGYDGRGFSLAVRSGQLVGWGTNEESRLGRPTVGGEADRSLVPVPIAPATRVFAGPRSGCLLDASGTLRCWGAPEPYGAMGLRDTPTPLAIPNAIEVVATYAATCARTADQRLFCVGRGDGGELLGMGAGATPVELDFGLSTGFSQLAAGHTHLCLLERNGRVDCWGANDAGQLGRADAGGVASVSGLTDATEVAAGGRHTCAIRANGRVVCFGTGTRGELGDGNDVSSNAPVEVAGITNAVQLALGREHSCARLATGAVRCWGRNDAAQLGDGTLTDRPTPVAVSGLADAAFLVAGDDHACARRTGGQIVCWGKHDQGELGDGTDTLSVPFPVPVDGLTDAVELAAGSATRTCARRAGGQVVCWGAAPLGDGTANDSASPRPVASITDAVQLGGHLPATCIRRSGGQLACFGSALLGGAAPSNSPVTVAGLASASLVSHGPSARHACALTTDGLRCFGNDDAGELGDGGTTDSPTPVAPTFTLPSITQLAVATVSAFGRGRTCAVYDGGRVGCWGSNLGGVLGNGSGDNVDRPTPVDATGLADVTHLALGDLHSCARSSTGQVHCWGLNVYGEVGDGTTEQRTAPTLVTLPSAVDVGAHAGISCATLASGAVRCWGRGEVGRLGTSDHLPRTTPTEVTGLTNAVQVAVADAACARLTTGSVVCWGPRAGLGNEARALSPRSPVSVVFP